MSPQVCALFCRWAVAFWVCAYGALYAADWDERNTFPNVLRPELDMLTAAFSQRPSSAGALRSMGRCLCSWCHPGDWQGRMRSSTGGRKETA